MPFSIPDPPPLPKHLRGKSKFPQRTLTVDGVAKPEGPPNEIIHLGYNPICLWPVVSVALSVISLCISVYTALNH